ncbi:MAG TPA: inositol monophosphatase family protein [Pirellulales bacterium]|nr:inositol monophosphatase family protein [Pirellulales bacterium]
MPDFLAVCEQAARAGGATLLEWVERFTVREKAPSDLVTDADVASQEAVRKIVLGAFPDHDFLSEEEPWSAPPSGSVPRYRWILDPLDGTTNYVHRIPDYAVSLALERGGEVLAATVFNPVHGECYTAAAGKGAYLNGRRISASGVTELAHAVVAASFPPKMTADSPILADFTRIIVASQSVRRTGSAALNLCYIAAGRFDGFWARDTKVWDVAAGFLAIREAGGIMTGLDGSPFRLDRPEFIAAATEPLHRELRSMLG